MFIIFDYDGVIIDSSAAVHKAVDVLYASLGRAPVSRSEALRWIGPSIAASIRRMRADLDLADDRQGELEQRYFDAYVACAPRMTPVFPGMLDLLDSLDAANIPKALATMKARTEFDAMSAPLPGIDRFDIIAAPPDHFGSSKKILVGEALEALALPVDDGVMVGDRASDVEAGKAHGLRTIAVTWGAGTRDELRAADPDVIVSSMAELRNELLG